MTTSNSPVRGQAFIDRVGARISSTIEAHKARSSRSAVVRVLNGVAAIVLTYLLFLPILAHTFGSQVWEGSIAPALISIVATVLFLGALEGIGVFARRSKAREHARGGHVSPF